MTGFLDDGADDPFLAASRQALRQSAGSDGDVLTSLGWWDLLGDLADPEARAAAFALFRAQGRELVTTGALAGLLAHPYLGTDGAGTGAVVATIARCSPRRGPVLLVVGDVTADHLLVDRPGSGAWIVDAAQVELHPVEVPGHVRLHEVDGALGALAGRRPTVDEARAEPARRRSHQLGRIALAFDVLGAAEGALAAASDHAAAREQFGQPIATFQAVRHLLAWSATDCAAVHAVARQAVDLDRTAPPGYDEVVKALAGRNGRRACERALQVLGAIGFTAEHDHHHFHSRVLALDALLGTSAELTHGLGARWREERTDPRVPATVLLGSPGQ